MMNLDNKEVCSLFVLLSVQIKLYFKIFNLFIIFYCITCKYVAYLWLISFSIKAWINLYNIFQQ